MNTATGTQLIESYLRTRQVRYFRGHHDDEYFFLVNAYHGRLHVHLQPSAAGVRISITAERYYPAERRARVGDLVEQWNNADSQVGAEIFESSDPQLIGVLAECRYRSGRAEFGSFTDRAVQSAIDLFGRLSGLAAMRSDGAHLRDAG